MPTQAGTCARDRRALQQLVLNVHVKFSNLAVGDPIEVTEVAGKGPSLGLAAEENSASAVRLVDVMDVVGFTSIVWFEFRP